MKKVGTLIIVFFISLFVLASQSFAADEMKTEKETTTQKTTTQTSTEGMDDIYRASKIIGKDVQNAQDEDLGEIQELVIDPSTGRVKYAVLAFGGVLGVSEKLFAVPMKALKYDSEEDAFILNANKEKLENAPGFDRNNWPDMANEKWDREVYEFYGQEYED